MRHRLIIVSLHLGIFLALAFGYEHFIVPLYGYEGYVFLPNAENGYIALIAVVALSLVTPIAFHKPSTLFYQYTLIFVLIPMLMLFYAENKHWEYPAQVLSAYLLSVLLAPILNIKPPRISSVSAEKLPRILLLVSLFYIAMVLLLGGAAYFNFDFAKVYDFRSEAADNLPWPFGYVSPMVGKVIIPVGLVLSMVKRKYLFASLYLVCASVVFGLTSHKATLFDPFLVLFVYAVSSGKNLTAKFNAGILIVLLLSIADFYIYMGSVREDSVFGWLGSLMFGRSFILPAEINYMYYDFFSRNDWVLFSDSKISFGLVEFNYPLDIAHMIGREYFNSDQAGANTGWFGSGYAQAGFAGLLLYGAATAAIYNYVDACARNSGQRRLVTASILIPISALITSSDLPTALLTHGLLLNLILIACIRGRQAVPASQPRRRKAIVHPIPPRPAWNQDGAAAAGPRFGRPDHAPQA